MQMREKIWLLAILVVSFLVFLPEIHHSLVFDDHLLRESPKLTAWSYVPGYFTSRIGPDYEVQNLYYRPVSVIWMRLQYATLGAPRPIWHLASILAHLITTACVFKLVRRLVNDFQGAALAATLFTIYPIQTETVAWISASGELLLTSFLVLSVYFYAVRKGPISLPSIGFAALAMFAKETGILAPALIFAYEWTQSRFKNAIVSAAPYALPALLYFAFRWNALKGNLLRVSDSTMTIGTMVLTWPRILAMYVCHLIWPVHLSICYDARGEIAFWPFVLLIVVVGGLVWLVRRSSANVRFGAIWFAITLLPALAIRYLTFNDYVHDRYLYLPSVGLAIIVAGYFGRIRFTLPRSIAACVLALLLCWGTRMNLSIWQDNLSLYRRGFETAPNNILMENNLAAAYLAAHREAEAYPLLKELIERYPNDIAYNYNMAVYYKQVGNYEAADHYLSISNQLNAILAGGGK